jgi:hypothetical protein
MTSTSWPVLVTRTLILSICMAISGPEDTPLLL